MDRNLELKQYAAAFAYFLLKRIERAQLECIRYIILFGSVSQGRATKGSDVDVFIDSGLPPSRLRTFRSKILRMGEEFLLSNEALSYKARGIYNPLNIMVGNLSNWQEMKKSISFSGIVLYGPYHGGFSRKALHHKIIFFWEAEGKRRGAFLNKLYGYTTKGKKYTGAIQRLGGAKIGKSAAIVPAEKGQKFTAILDSYKIRYKVLEVFV